MSWLHYLLEANIYLGVFYLGYYILLKNETHYLLNRVYLLLSCLLSFLVPFTQLSILRPAEAVVQQQVTVLPALQHVNVVHLADAAPVTPFTLGDDLIALYILGAVITLALLFHRLYLLFSLIRRNKALPANRYKVIELSGEHTAFSFFNYLFIGSGLSQAEIIVAHELVHIRQKHSADIIFLELIKVISWFNPFVYIIQRSLKTVHEYIADEQTAAREADCLAYSSFLLHNAYGLQGSALAHSFFNYNLLKKRIIMLNQKRSGRLARLKYLAAVPLCAGMLCASTLVFSKDYGVIDLSPVQIKATHDTTFAIRPPAIFNKDYILQENGYLIDKEKEYYTVTITDKAGNTKIYNNITATAAERKLLADKYGYQFKSYQIKKLMSTPSAPPKKTTGNMLPPPPPPTFVKDAYIQLAQYISQKVSYPKDAFIEKQNAALIASFTLGTDGRISNISFSGNGGESFKTVLEKGISSFPYKIKDKPGRYKMGVTFFMLNTTTPQLTGIDKNSIEYVGETGVVGLTDAQRKTLNAPTAINRKPPPPPPVIEKAPPAAAQINRRPPPPPPYDIVYKDLIMYVAKHTRYPAVAHNNKINGNVFLSLNLNSKHQVGDVKIEKGIGYGCDEEAARALRSYTGVIDKAPGTYKLVVTFMSMNNDGTLYGKPVQQNLGKLLNSPHFIGQVVIATSVD